MSLTIFNKEYNGYEMYDLDRDINFWFYQDYMPEFRKLPIGVDNEPVGKFTVSITWSEE